MKMGSSPNHQFALVDTRSESEKSEMYVRRGYEYLNTDLLRLGRASLGCTISKKELISTLEQRLEAVREDYALFSKKAGLKVDEHVTTINGINRFNVSDLILDKNAKISSPLEECEYKRDKIKTVLANLLFTPECNGKGKFSNCCCPRDVKDFASTCTYCRNLLERVFRPDPNIRLIRRSEMIGPLLCGCAACLVYRGLWKDREVCECFAVTIDSPLQMCTNCLCSLAVEQYIDFKNPTSFPLSTNIYRELLTRERILENNVKAAGSGSRSRKIYMKRVELVKIRDTMLALIPENAADGCNGNRRFNDCKCPDVVTNVNQTCSYCLWWIAKQPKFPATVYGPIYCGCSKCLHIDFLDCKCKTHLRDLAYLCIRCLCKLAVEYNSGKSVCFCSKVRKQYACGSDTCPNPVRYCKHKPIKGGLQCDATHCINAL
jgi:hypothetical protein